MTGDNQIQSNAEVISTTPVEATIEPQPLQVVDQEPLTLEKKAYIFNQFYFDLLKKVKTEAKKKKENSKEARDVLRAIKNSYSSYETGSVEYIQKFEDTMTAEFWEKYYECSLETVDKFVLSDVATTSFVYHNISVAMIMVCLQDAFIVHHYLTIFAILMENMSNDDTTKALTMLKNFKNKDISSEFDTIVNENARKWIVRLYNVYTQQMANVFGNQFADIEQTSLGKLAKEIMEEVDLSTIQNSISNEGDILKSLTDPNSGIASLLGTVSQKMISKLASGEIKQENLLEDAMKFATKLPALGGGGAGAGAGGLASLLGGGGGGAGGLDFGKMTSMMQNMMGMMGGLGGGDDDGASGSGGMDMGALMNMMQGMMGGNGAKAKRSMANNPKATAAYSTAKTMSNSARKAAQIQKIRQKIEKRKTKETKENIPDQVE